MQFTPGHFQTFEVTRDFRLGPADAPHSYQPALHKGEHVKFDGESIIIGQLPPYCCPQVRGCVALGWLILV